MRERSAPHLPNRWGHASRRRELFDGSFDRTSGRTEFHSRATGGL